MVTELITNTVVSLNMCNYETLLGVLLGKLGFLKFKTIVLSCIEDVSLSENSKQFLINLRKHSGSSDTSKYRAICSETNSDCFGEPDEALARLIFNLMLEHKIKSATFTISL
jgi:hypothetical protein